MQVTVRQAAAVAFLVLLTGCGGSGQQTSSSETEPSVSLAPPASISEEEARQQLQARADAKSTQQTLGMLRGEWVPQYSQLCAGQDADIAGGMPDGTIDTPGVTEGQILEFHQALERNEELYLYTIDLADVSDEPVDGPCAGKPVWLAITGLRYPDPQSVYASCEKRGFPNGTCAARYIPSEYTPAPAQVYFPDELPASGYPTVEPAVPNDQEAATDGGSANDSGGDSGSTTDNVAPPIDAGPSYVSMPNMLGMDANEAQADLRANGFPIVGIAPDMPVTGNQSQPQAGDICVVTRQNPSAGASIPVTNGVPQYPSVTLYCR